MKRAISVVATMATLLTAGSVAAAEHTILILPDAYFPQITYLDEGDTVRFINVSGGEHNIIAKNGTWEIGPIANEAEATLVVDQALQKTFYDKAAVGEDGEYIVEGRMTFAPAPSN